MAKRSNSLYVHIPFCQNKCFYCSFVIAVGQEHRVDQYLDCLAREAEKYQGRTIQTVYLGGGTPSFLNISQLEKLNQILRKHFLFSSDCEFTLEANPESITSEKVRCFKQIGINRVSLGVQTFQEKYLKYLGRVHDSKKALEAFDVLRKTGFDNINVDLMFSFPDQSKAELVDDLEKIKRLNSDHVSLYSLTIEENSRFYAQKVKLSSQENQAEDYLLIVEHMEKFGFHQYEVSNFAKPGKESKHNLNYWIGGDYIGLGVGAHAHFSGRRSWNGSKLIEYIKKVEEGSSPEEGFEVLTAEQQSSERFLFGLRMNKGVDIEIMKDFIKTREPIVAEAVKEGYLIIKNNRLYTTLKGRLVLDELSSRLI